MIVVANAFAFDTSDANRRYLEQCVTCNVERIRSELLRLLYPRLHSHGPVVMKSLFFSLYHCDVSNVYRNERNNVMFV